MAKTSTIFARVEPEVKAQAEQVLEQLGIPISSAVSMFLKQIVLHRGIPFALKLPADIPLFYDELTKEQFDREIGKGMAEAQTGQVFSADEVEAEWKGKLGNI